MTEEEYTIVSTLIKVRNVEALLRDIIPSDASGIEQGGLAMLVGTVQEWRESLEYRVRIDADVLGAD